MRRSFLKLAAILALPLGLAGCVTDDVLDVYAAPDAGFMNVAADVSAKTGKDAVWIQNARQAEATAARVHALVHRKTISADTAVQVALLNNKGLQAAYADIGLSAVNVWQEALPENPKVAIGVTGIGTPNLDAFKAIEVVVANNILRLATRERRMEIADTRFRQAQKRAILETLMLAGRTRAAWINAVGAFETVGYLNQAQNAADAASELAEQLGRSGALPKAGQAREHVFFAELTGQKAEAKLAARMAKEELTRLMGLWGEEVDYFVPDKLPALPKGLKAGKFIERAALENRVDIQIAKLELEALAQSYKFGEATRYLTDFEIIAGTEVEREFEDGETKGKATGQVEFEFVIPIFNTGKPRMRKAELAYMRAANQLAELAVNARSEARSAYTEYKARYELARHYRNSVIPLRTTIEEEALLTYNGMITSTFDLLADTRAKINAMLLSANAKRNFWLADANLGGVIVAGTSGASGGQAMSLADGGSGAPH